MAQVAASVPATALCPVVLLLLVRVGEGLGVGSIVLLVLGTQWYVLFNVIVGYDSDSNVPGRSGGRFSVRSRRHVASPHSPRDFRLVCDRIGHCQRGAWNASIVAEYFISKGRRSRLWASERQSAARPTPVIFPCFSQATAACDSASTAQVTNAPKRLFGRPFSAILSWLISPMLFGTGSRAS
jgi:hypothetical protein